MQTRRIDPQQKDNARQLRRELSPAEQVLWRLLRDRRLAAFKFRRQHLLGAYIVDFVCLQKKLIVELDGESHLSRNREDEHRDQWLQGQGYKIVRVWNTTLFGDMDAVLETIWRECSKT